MSSRPAVTATRSSPMSRASCASSSASPCATAAASTRWSRCPSDRMRIAITLGDPNGIGPEVAIKAAQHFARHSTIKPLLVGDGFVIEETANRLGLDATPPFIDAAVLDPAGFAPGTLDPRAGKATVGYVAAAVKLVNEGKADAIVGCPHSETAVNRAGIPFSGYPGLVADLTGTPRDRAFMMLTAKGLKGMPARFTAVS